MRVIEQWNDGVLEYWSIGWQVSGVRFQENIRN